MAEQSVQEWGKKQDGGQRGEKESRLQSMMRLRSTVRKARFNLFADNLES